MEHKTMYGVAKDDQVDHPKHYTYGNIECIDFIESCGFGYDFCIGNTIKYCVRAKHKGTQLQDLKKARWYLDRAIQSLESGAANV